MKSHRNPILSVAISRVRQLLEQCRESEAIPHAATKGALREGYLKQFLADVVPPPFRVTSGFITDCRGEDVSPQLDLIVFDPSIVPGYALSEFATIVPIEAALLSIEVKSQLRSADLDQVQSQHDCLKRLRLAATSSQREFLTTVSCVGLPIMIAALDVSCSNGSLATYFANVSSLFMICVVGKFTMLRDPQSGAIETIDADENHTEVMQFLALAHRLIVETAESSRSISVPNGKDSLELRPDIGAYLTFDIPHPME